VLLVIQADLDYKVHQALTVLLVIRGPPVNRDLKVLLGQSEHQDCQVLLAQMDLQVERDQLDKKVPKEMLDLQDKPDQMVLPVL